MQKATGDDSRSMAGFAIVFALIMGGVLAMIVNSGKVFHFSEGIGVSEIIILAVAGGLPLAAIGWAIYTIVIHRRSAAVNRVDILEGTVRLRLRRHRTLVLREIVIGDRALAINEAAYGALEDGLRYRVYVVPIAEVVVGIESIA